MHLHAYLATGVRPANVPPHDQRQDWEPDEIFTEAKAAVEWLTNATRELCAKPDMNLTDEAQVWTATLNSGESVHTGAGETSILMEADPDCGCNPSDGGSIAPLRRTRRR